MKRVDMVITDDRLADMINTFRDEKTDKFIRDEDILSVSWDPNRRQMTIHLTNMGENRQPGAQAFQTNLYNSFSRE